VNTTTNKPMDERDPRPMDDAGQDVPAEMVRAEQLTELCGRKRARALLRSGFEGGQQVRGEGESQDQENERSPDQEGAMGEKTRQRRGGRARARRGGKQRLAPLIRASRAG
jgi:hypothetical protein